MAGHALRHDEWCDGVAAPSDIFPDAVYHLVEPQHGCLPLLKQMAERSPRIHVHATALTWPGVPAVVMVGGGDDQTATGNFIPTRATSEAPGKPTSSPSTTLDALFGDLTASRLLLELDVDAIFVRRESPLLASSSWE